MSAQELRKAAETLRGLALNVPQGYWWAGLAKLPTDPEGDWVVDSADRLIAGNIGIESDREADAIASYVAAMYPAVALGLAGVLNAAALAMDATSHGGADLSRTELKLLGLARLINGDAS